MHDLKSLTHDGHVRGRRSTELGEFAQEVLPVGITPVLKRAIALALVKGERGIDLDKWEDVDLGGADDAPGNAMTVEYHAVIPGYGDGLALSLIRPQRTGSGALGAVENARQQAVTLFDAVAELPSRI